jgi:hypothetical protein
VLLKVEARSKQIFLRFVWEVAPPKFKRAPRRRGGRVGDEDEDPENDTSNVNDDND